MEISMKSIKETYKKKWAQNKYVDVGLKTVAIVALAHVAAFGLKLVNVVLPHSMPHPGIPEFFILAAIAGLLYVQLYMK